ncbi:MAG: oligosaccharide flippase family protein, partial [Ignavibacteriae bacterium]|nr:oligosaccharide flippase family protein [Ignavibacteriota bacterium]
LGISTVIIQFNSEVSKIIISANLGVTALAFYSVGSQKLPFIPIIRNSVSNVVFPDVVEKMGSSTMEALDLWKRSVTLYIFFMAPIFVVFFYYAELVVVTLYTKEYIDATPIFQIYLILIIYHCFDMGIPIRGMNKNKLLLMGHIASLFVNIGLLYVLFNLLGMIGPPIAYVTTEILLTIFFGAKVLSIYKIKFKEIFYWDEIFKLLAISIVPIVILFGGNYLPINDIVRAIVFSSVYLAAYYYLVRKLNIEYLNTFITRIQTNLLSKLKVKF